MDSETAKNFLIFGPQALLKELARKPFPGIIYLNPRKLNPPMNEAWFRYSNPTN